MKRIAPLIAIALLAGCGHSEGSNPAADRQATATRTTMNAADREIGMPRIANFAQRKLLKNAYEDMDQTTLVYVYTQALDGRFVCLGQALGYGVSLGTQFTAPTYPQAIDVPNVADGYTITEQAQPEPNGLYMPDSGAATIVNLVDPSSGKARTALVEANVMTVPFQLPASAVAVACPAAIDPSRVSDGKEVGIVKQRD